MFDEVLKLGDKFRNYLRFKYNSENIDYLIPLTKFGLGQSTSIYRFQLSNAPEEISQPLVLRLFRDTAQGYSTGLAYKEGTIQNILLQNNYPTARAHIICEDMNLIGEEFIVMDFMRGKPMLEAVAINKIPDMLAAAHVKLHKINPSSFIESLKKSRVSKVWYDGTVFVDIWITSRNVNWLKPGLKWINENEPKVRNSAICHGDFHPFNILVDNGEISAVLDWSSARIGDLERDIASTKNILTTFGPSVVPEIDYVSFTDEYLASYSERSHADLEKVQYYEAVHCINILESLEAGFVNDLPGVRDRLINRFYDITGLNLIK